MNEYATIRALKEAIAINMDFYNNRRWHQALDYSVPADVYAK